MSLHLSLPQSLYLSLHLFSSFSPVLDIFSSFHFYCSLYFIPVSLGLFVSITIININIITSIIATTITTIITINIIILIITETCIKTVIIISSQPYFMFFRKSSRKTAVTPATPPQPNSSKGGASFIPVSRQKRSPTSYKSKQFSPPPATSTLCHLIVRLFLALFQCGPSCNPLVSGLWCVHV